MRGAVEEVHVPAAGVEDAVVEGAEQDCVVEVGRAVWFTVALVPGFEVRGLASGGGFVAAEPGAAAVPDGHGVALGFAEEAPGLAEVEWLGVAAEDDGENLGVAGDPACGLGAEMGWSMPEMVAAPIPDRRASWSMVTSRVAAVPDMSPRA